MIEKLKLAIHHAEQTALALRSIVEALPYKDNPIHAVDDTPAFTATYETETPLNFVPTEATNPKIIVTEEVKPVMTDREALISYTEQNGKASALEILALCGAKKLSDIKDSKMFRELLGR